MAQNEEKYKRLSDNIILYIFYSLFVVDLHKCGQFLENKLHGS